jgi:hypothetical protein
MLITYVFFTKPFNVLLFDLGCSSLNYAFRRTEQKNVVKLKGVSDSFNSEF